MNGRRHRRDIKRREGGREKRRDGEGVSKQANKKKREGVRDEWKKA